MKIKVEAFIEFEVVMSEIPKNITIENIRKSLRDDVNEVLDERYTDEKIKVVARIED